MEDDDGEIETFVTHSTEQTGDINGREDLHNIDVNVMFVYRPIPEGEIIEIPQMIDMVTKVGRTLRMGDLYQWLNRTRNVLYLSEHYSITIPQDLEVVHTMVHAINEYVDTMSTHDSMRAAFISNQTVWESYELDEWLESENTDLLPEIIVMFKPEKLAQIGVSNSALEDDIS